MDKRSIENRSRERLAFAYYLRTGRRLPEEPASSLGVKFNPWHDPRNGQFTFARGGPRSLSGAVHVPRSGSWQARAPAVDAPGERTSVVARAERDQCISVRIPPPEPDNGRRLPDGGISVRIPLPADAPCEQVAAERIRAGATRVWPVAGDGRPAERGDGTERPALFGRTLQRDRRLPHRQRRKAQKAYGHRSARADRGARAGGRRRRGSGSGLGRWLWHNRRDQA